MGKLNTTDISRNNLNHPTVTLRIPPMATKLVDHCVTYGVKITVSAGSETLTVYSEGKGPDLRDKRFVTVTTISGDVISINTRNIVMVAPVTFINTLWECSSDETDYDVIHALYVIGRNDRIIFSEKGHEPVKKGYYEKEILKLTIGQLL